MILQNRRLRNVIAGALGGFLGWLLLVEPIVAPRLAAGLAGGLGEMLPLDALLGALAGAAIGLALGAAEGLVDRAWARAARSGAIALAAGAVGGTLGLVVGEIVYQPLAMLCCVGRAVGWGLFGAILGVSEGLVRGSARGMRNGMLGGLAGGAIGGVLFDLVGMAVLLLGGSDGPSRGIALTVLGACLGFWIAVVEQTLSPALLRVMSGRLEGKEFLLDKPAVSVGSSERSDVALFGDAAVEPRHAVLRWANEAYTLEAMPGAPVTVNGAPAARQVLAHGDQVVFGATRTVFRRKAQVGAASRRLGPVALPGRAAPLPAPAAPAAPGAPLLPAGQAGAFAVALVDERSGRRYPLAGAGELAVGRDPAGAIVLDDPAVSACHAVLRREPVGWVITDQGSRNGVYVNERRISGANLLRPGWRVRLGDTPLRVE